MQYFDDHFPKMTFFSYYLTSAQLFLIGSTTDQKERGWQVGARESSFLYL